MGDRGHFCGARCPNVTSIVAHKVKKATQPAWFAYALGAISGLTVGVAGLIGGGPIMAGLMLMGLDMPHAAATSSYALVALSVIGCLLHATLLGRSAAY